jgi:hypothetical protein
MFGAKQGWFIKDVQMLQTPVIAEELKLHPK